MTADPTPSEAALVELEALAFVGQGLKRPECILSTRAGSLFVSDWEGGVARLAPDGGITRTLEPEGWLRPNGIGLRPDGSFLIAHLGDDSGGLYHLLPDGALRPILLEIDGTPLPPSNYPLEDEAGRIWLTVSTRRVPRDTAYRADIADGFIILIDDRGARIAADGLGYTNEIRIDPSGDWLYVNETFARRMSRFRLAADGALSDKETVTEFGPGSFPDGMAFDSEGAVWVTCIVSNRVIRVLPDGRQELILEDADGEHLDWVETAYQERRLGRPHLDKIPSRRLRNISSLAFGGPDLKTVYLGCLLGDSIAHFRSPIAGLPPPYWDFAV